MRFSDVIFVFCIGLPIILSAQTYRVSGTVKDNENKTVPFANVFLLSTVDSTMVQGTSSNEEGIFSMDAVVPQTYFVKASYIGSTSDLRAIDVHEDVKIGTLIIDQNARMLEEVTVTSRRPTLVRKADRLIFNVENTVASQGNSWDLLKKTPGVIVMSDEMLIRGRQAAIYLNNRKVQLSPLEVKDFLEGLSGVNIKSVEVIQNPPAQYDSESGPILNIVTSKNIIPGYKGSFNGNYTQAIFPKYSFGTNHYLKTKRLNLYGNYSISPKKEFKHDEGHINFMTEANDVYARWENDFNRITRSLGQNATVVLDYTMDDRNHLNITSNLAFSPNKKFNNRVNVAMNNAQNQLDSTLLTKSNLEMDHTNLAVDVTYKHLFKKEGASLSLNGDFTSFKEDRTQFASSDYFNPSMDFIRNYSFFTNSMQDIQIATGQADYSTPVIGSTLESGTKFSTIRSESGTDFFNVDGPNRTYNMNFSDKFKYRENVWAAYVSVYKNWKKWSVKGGLRGELTDVEGTSIATNTRNAQNYFELFPSLYLLYTPSEKNSFSLDYSRKLQRPKYEDLNPFRYFLNENNFTIGNPNLQPNFSNNFNFNYTLKGTYFFDLYYRDNGAYISTLSFQDNENQVLRSSKQNVLKSISYGLDFTYANTLMQNWYVYSYMSLFSEEETFLALESNNQMATNKVQGFYVSLSNYLTLSKDGSFTGETGLTYMSRYLQASYVLSGTTNLTLGLRKSLWKNRAVLSLAIEDLLGKANGKLTSKYLNQDNSYFPKPETRFVRFGFTYNFGNFKLSDNQKEINKAERDRLTP